MEAHYVIKQPILTEKSTFGMNERGQYSFLVDRTATKDQIKAAVQELFGVRVKKVRTQQRIGKKRRYRFKMGQLSRWKKAIVTLHEEDRIEFF